MFFRGPFLGLLQTCPPEAVDVIMALVHFTTDRWGEWDMRWHRRQGTPEGAVRRSAKVLIDGRETEWKGDLRVYGWYRDRFGNAAVVVAALMALEKWLYDLLDTKQDTTEWLSMILKRSRSVAMAGVLAAVTRKYPALLAGPLRPLMSIWEVYGWEYALRRDEQSFPPWRISMMEWSRLGEQIFNMVRDWHQLPHRKTDFLGECIKLLLTKSA
jgi:hypothetical protein